MVLRLFLSESDFNKTNDVITSLLPLLNKLGSQIQSLLSNEARSEARLWLCTAISNLSVSHRRQVNVFMKLFRSKPRKVRLLSQLLLMMFEKCPSKFGSLLAKRSYLLERFFQENPKHVLDWFSEFAFDGGSDHKRGAKALAQFAFANRDICWEELEWRGKHGQSPAVVATKPHYFLDLDVKRTVENFIDNVPEFWSSNEFAESLKDGKILSLDTKYFVDLFIRFMYDKEEEDMNDDVWDVVEEFLMESSFSYLTRHLLITLDEPDLCRFLEFLGDCFVDSSWDSTKSCLLGLVVSRFGERGGKSFDELLLVNSVINQGRQLLRVVNDDDGEMKLKETMEEICRGLDSNGGVSFSLIMREISKMKQNVEVIKLLGLLSWTIHLRLSEECKTLDSWEALFRENGIDFRRSSSDHSLLSVDEESESDSDIRRKKKQKREKKKRKKLAIDDDDDDDEILGIHSRSRSWLLCTDGFSATWTSVDLPEHISRYCLSTWMKKWLKGKQK
ncbi:unnamed protein product [Cochlearia groenlandica]